MTNASSTGSIVVGVDGSSDSLAAARWAAGLVGRGTRRSILLLEAVALPPIPSQPWLESAEALIERAESEAKARLAGLSDELRTAGVEASARTRRWLPAESILELAREVGAGLIVVGRRGRSARQTLLGSVSGEVSRAAAVPVVVVRGDSSVSPPRRLLLAVDGSAASRAAIAAAAAWFPDAALVIATVHERGEELSEADLSRELASAGVRDSAPDVRVLSGNPAAALLDLARNEAVDLVCAGRRGHGPLHDLFVGSVAEKLLQLSPCPLLLAH